jgi:hypothetical protein
MVLIDSYNLVDGSEWTADLANLAFDPVFNDQTQFLNNHPRLTDDSLSNIAGNIKPRVNAIEDTLRLTQGLGTVVTWSAGTVALPDGTVALVSSGSHTLLNDGTFFFWVNAAGVVGVGLLAAVPTVRLMMGRVVTSGGTISVLENRRTLSVRPVQPAAASIKVFGGISVTDKTCEPNEVLGDGFYYFRDFIVPNGVTIRVPAFAKIFCSGRVDIAGTINVEAATAGASSFSTAVIAGVNLGGGSGSGLGGGSGSSATASRAYSYAASPYGSGGGGGFVAGLTPGSGTVSSGGAGGGGLWIEAASTLTVRGTANINANGGNANPGVAVNPPVQVSGAGGGSGGLIYLSSILSISIEPGANIRVNGGNGSTAVANNIATQTNGGAGGGGGWIVLASPSTNNQSLGLVFAAGSAGANTGTGGTPLGGGNGGAFGGAGGAASNGTIGRLLSLAFSPIGV